jgi:F-type H+-transporting ATPase subunit delta
VRDTTVAANYAETLLELAQRAGDAPGWGVLVGDLAAAIDGDPTLRQFLASPRIAASLKNEILIKAFGGRLPATFVRFLESLVRHRRQLLIPEIAAEYNRMLDQMEGRLRADVTVARPLTPAESKALATALTRAVGAGKTVVPVVRIHPAILGGVIVRVGDGVADGSVRARLAKLRRALGASRASAGVVQAL